VLDYRIGRLDERRFAQWRDRVRRSPSPEQLGGRCKQRQDWPGMGWRRQGANLSSETKWRAGSRPCSSAHDNFVSGGPYPVHEAIGSTRGPCSCDPGGSLGDAESPPRFRLSARVPSDQKRRRPKLVILIEAAPCSHVAMARPPVRRTSPACRSRYRGRG
jgi:hypothetical protein